MQTVDERTTLFQRDLEGVLRAALDCDTDEEIQYLVLASRRGSDEHIMTKPVIVQALFGDITRLVLRVFDRCEKQTKLALFGAFDIARAVSITKALAKESENVEEDVEE